MELAFSRDQDEKIYVQHKMQEKSREFFDWIDSRGALVYLCGNKRTMGKDVKNALKKIISLEGNLSVEKAEAYLQRMVKNKQLRSDLY
jgi:sulfite reductase (NADPH) flavoprotein alpha-component